MKSVSGAVQSLFASRNWQMGNLFQFALVGGSNLYYTSNDTDILWSSNLYSSGGTTGPYFDRESNKAKMVQKIGTAADELEFDVIAGSATINGLGFLAAIQQGVFDGAEVTYSGAYWAKSSSGYTKPIVPAGVVIKMVGRVAEVDAGRSVARFRVNSHLELLNLQMPRNLYQSPCSNTLFDTGCTLLASSYQVTGSASSGSTSSAIKASLAQATGYFSLGQIQFTSGILNGVSRPISSYTNGSPSTVNLMYPFPSAPGVGDTFNILPGCDKTMTTCTNKYSNLLHYRGQPYIPVSETAI